MKDHQLLICMSLEEESSKPYFLIERYPCSEGFRTRVCGQTFSTKEEARQWKKSVEKGTF